jgi:hypothetical protein
MVGLDPNAPPPKATRVKLERWEYSDPIGVPHPEILDVTAQISNHSDRDDVTIRPKIEIQWLEGAEDNKSSARWGKKILLTPPESFRLGPSETRTLRYPIGLAEKMTVLSKTHEWPWSLRATISTSVPGSAEEMVAIELPISPAD